MARSPWATVAHTLLVAGAACLPLAAAASPDLARQKNCLNCHAADRKLVGPAWQDVARRYAKLPGAAKSLAVKVRAGGAGAWGVVPMPANPSLSEAEAERLAAWVLTHQ